MRLFDRDAPCCSNLGHDGGRFAAAELRAHARPRQQPRLDQIGCPYIGHRIGPLIPQRRKHEQQQGEDGDDGEPAQQQLFAQAAFAPPVAHAQPIGFQRAEFHARQGEAGFAVHWPRTAKLAMLPIPPSTGAPGVT